MRDRVCTDRAQRNASGRETHAQRLRAALEARYDGSMTSKGPSGTLLSLAAAATGLAEASLELITATTLRPPSLACTQQAGIKRRCGQRSSASIMHPICRCNQNRVNMVSVAHQL